MLRKPIRQVRTTHKRHSEMPEILLMHDCKAESIHVAIATVTVLAAGIPVCHTYM